MLVASGSRSIGVRGYGFRAHRFAMPRNDAGREAGCLTEPGDTTSGA